MPKDIQKLRFFYNTENKSDENRLDTALILADAIAKTEEVNMETVGREICKDKQQNGVAKMKRFLKSKYTSKQLLYYPFLLTILSVLCKGYKELYLVVDGTDIGKSCGSLMISAIFGNYNIPLVWQTKTGNKGHFSMEEHIDLFKKAQIITSSIISNFEKVIVLGDGEFYAHGLVNFIKEQKWNYGFRMAKDTWIEDENSDTYQISELDIDPILELFFLENCLIGKKKEGLINVMANIVGCYDKKDKKPMYLVSDMDCPFVILEKYKIRWQIETFFSNIKSRGFNIHKTRIKKPEMLDNLLILVCLAFCFCQMIASEETKGEKILNQKLRKDRLHSYSKFTKGLNIFRYCKENEICTFELFISILDKNVT